MISTLRVRDIRTSRAKCVGKSELMFSENTELAKQTCEGCPERKRCLMVALDNDIDYGVWGGLDFEERTHLCPICRHSKLPEELGCTPSHKLERLARLIELQAQGDTTISVGIRGAVSAPTSPGCIQPRGRSHSSTKAYRNGCRCERSRRARSIEGAERRRLAQRRILKTPEERFMQLVEIDGEHWWWRGATNGSGYGNFWDGKRTVRAHLFAYQIFKGPVASNSRLRAVGDCSPKRCCNPDHHELVTAC